VCSSLGLAFAPQVKFVMKGRTVVKSQGSVDASRSKDSEDKAASESDAESTDDDVTSSGDEQKMTNDTDDSADESKYEDEDDELLVKKTRRSKKHLELQDDDKHVAEPAESQVRLEMTATWSLDYLLDYAFIVLASHHFIAISPSSSRCAFQ